MPYVLGGLSADQDAVGLDVEDRAVGRGTARLGRVSAAADIAVGVFRGLYRCRDGGSVSLLE